MTILVQNEREKVEAKMKSAPIGTYSASYGTSYTRSDSYTANYSYNEVPQGVILVNSSVKGLGEAGRSILKGMKDFIKGFGGNDKTFGKSAEEA